MAGARPLSLGARRAAVASVLIVGALAAVCAWRFRVETDVTQFLATAGPADLATLSRQLARSELNRTMVLTFKGPTPELGLAVAGRVADALEHHPEVAWIQTGPPDGVEEAVHALYFPRRFLFASDRPAQELPERLSDAGLRAAAQDLKRRLALPTGTLVKRVAKRDPLLLFPARLEALQAAGAGRLTVRNERFLTDDGWAVVFLASKHSAFDAPRQRRLLNALDAAFAEAAASAEAPIVMERSGVNLTAVHSETAIKADVTRISILSSVGIVLVFLLLFRSLRYLLLGLVPLAVGVLTALAVTLVTQGAVHGVTLAFGSALIGVCIDYPVHLFNHHTLDEDSGPTGAIARVWPGLLLGALTTVAGFSGLLGSGFPGLREIALFGVVGILAALAATRWLVAPLLPEPRPVPIQTNLANELVAGLGALASRRRLLLAAPLLALTVCGVGLPRLTWLDDPKGLYREDPALAKERDAVRARTSRVDGARFVICVGADAEQALRKNDAAALRLRELVARGALAGYRSLHAFLWSAALQRENAAAFAGRPHLAERLQAAFKAEGFRPALFDGFAADLAAPQPAPLTLPALQASALGPAVRPFAVTLADGRVAIVTLLRGVADPAALAAIGRDRPGVFYLDQNTFLSEVYAGYRTRVLVLLALGLLAVLALELFRYRRPRVVLAAFLPAVLAAATTLALLALFGVPVHLLHLAALLLVLSMGADYGIFLAETRAHPEGTGATLLSIALACLTTLLGFGALALSSAPVLRAIGLTCGLGVVLSLFLAPIALLLAGAPPPVGSSES